MKKPETDLDLDRDDDEEEIELFMANGETIKAKRWMIERALVTVARNRLVHTIRAEIGLIRYAERVNRGEEG